MPKNGQSEREAQGFHEPRISRVGLGVLVLVSTISVVVTAVWVMGPDARSDPKILSSPSPQASSSPVVVPVDPDERTIYLWDSASGEMQDLVSGPGLSGAELSPSGAGVVYEREEPNGLTQIYLFYPAGFERRLTDFPGGASDPTWSPSGKIAFSATPREVTGLGTGTDIFVMHRNGSHVHRLTGTPHDDLKPDWSPDGSRIAFHSRADDGEARLWVVSTRTHSLKELGARGPWSAAEPAWSPDGRWIAYIRYHHTNTINGNLYSSDLSRVRSDGSDDHLLAHRSGLIRSNPSWSPDGRLILYEQDHWNGGARRVSVSNARTGLARPFLPGTRGGWSVGFDSNWSFDPSWGVGGILVIRPNADPILTQPRIPSGFLSSSVVGGPGIDATITMSGSRCQLDGLRRPIPPGTLKLELVNGSGLEAHFTVVRIRGSLHDLPAQYQSFLFHRPRVTSLDPATTGVWSSKVPIRSGRWAVLCHKDKIPSPNGIFIVPVGIAGPLFVGTDDSATELMSR